MFLNLAKIDKIKNIPTLIGSGAVENAEKNSLELFGVLDALSHEIG